MTTEAEKFKIELASNLFEPNECINLPQSPNADVVAGLACVTVSQPVKPAQRSDLTWGCVEYARDLFLSRIGLWTWWLFACVCEEDSRVNRHQGLWKRLAKQGLSLPQQVSTETTVSKDAAHICIFGATGTEAPDILRFRSVVTPASRSFLALLPQHKTPPVDLVIAAGWERGISDLEELRDIAIVVSKQGGVLLRVFGEFDDRVAGVDCIMSDKTYKEADAALRSGYVS